MKDPWNQIQNEDAVMVGDESRKLEHTQSTGTDQMVDLPSVMAATRFEVRFGPPCLGSQEQARLQVKFRFLVYSCYN